MRPRAYYRAIQEELELLESVLLKVVKRRPGYQVLTSIPGIGLAAKILMAREQA